MADFHQSSVCVIECGMLLLHTAPENCQAAHDVSVLSTSNCQVSDTFKELSVSHMPWKCPSSSKGIQANARLASSTTPERSACLSSSCSFLSLQSSFLDIGTYRTVRNWRIPTQKKRRHLGTTVQEEHYTLRIHGYPCSSNGACNACTSIHAQGLRQV